MPHERNYVSGHRSDLPRISRKASLLPRTWSRLPRNDMEQQTLPSVYTARAVLLHVRRPRCCLQCQKALSSTTDSSALEAGIWNPQILKRSFRGEFGSSHPFRNSPYQTMESGSQTRILIAFAEEHAIYRGCGKHSRQNPGSVPFPKTPKETRTAGIRQRSSTLNGSWIFSRGRAAIRLKTTVKPLPRLYHVN